MRSDKLSFTRRALMVEDVLRGVVDAPPAERLSMPERLVLANLITRANDDGVCWPSAPALAADLDMNERTVRTVVARLQERGGYLEIDHGGHDQKRRLLGHDARGNPHFGRAFKYTILLRARDIDEKPQSRIEDPASTEISRILTAAKPDPGSDKPTHRTNPDKPTQEPAETPDTPATGLFPEESIEGKNEKTKSKTGPAERIFEVYKRARKAWNPNTRSEALVLSTKARKAISARMREGHTEGTLTLAARGIFLDPWEGRSNHIELETAMRSENVARFAAFAESDPYGLPPPTRTTSPDPPQTPEEQAAIRHRLGEIANAVQKGMVVNPAHLPMPPVPGPPATPEQIRQILAGVPVPKDPSDPFSRMIAAARAEPGANVRWSPKPGTAPARTPARPRELPPDPEETAEEREARMSALKEHSIVDALDAATRKAGGV